MKEKWRDANREKQWEGCRIKKMEGGKNFKRDTYGVPVVAQWLTNLTKNRDCGFDPWPRLVG